MKERDTEREGERERWEKERGREERLLSEGEREGEKER